MPWSVTWFDDEETIGFITPDQDWEWEEMQMAFSVFHTQMCTSKSHDVDLIVNFKGLPSPEARFFTLMRRALSDAPYNRRLVLLIADNPKFTEIVGTTADLLGQEDDFRFVNSFHAALFLLNREKVMRIENHSS